MLDPAETRLVPDPSPGFVDSRLYLESQLRQRAVGQPIGPNDLWIAAHALARDVPLITHNLSAFRCVPDLAVETWMTA